MPAVALQAPVLGPGAVTLRDLTSADLDQVYRWDGDRDLVALYGAPPSELVRSDSHRALAIAVGRRLVGLIGLTGISGALRSAELHVLIGDPRDRARGLGQAAVRAFLAWAFGHSNLELIFLRVLRGNLRAVRCFERCGFRRAGLLRVRSDERYTYPALADDVLLMTLERRSEVKGETGSGLTLSTGAV